MKCLVVEDIVLLRRITKSTLDRLGASVMECENGEQAVQTVEEGLTRNSSNRPCDFILMDCQVVMAIYYDFYFYLVISFWFCSSILLQIANDIS